MNVYYTAKDIEELAAKGVEQVEIGPGVTLTDFARETAQQLNVALVVGRRQALPVTPASSPNNTTEPSSKYNKPTGCQHASGHRPAAQPQAAVPSDRSNESAGSNTVNRLIDLMGKAIKRGE